MTVVVDGQQVLTHRGSGECGGKRVRGWYVHEIPPGQSVCQCGLVERTHDGRPAPRYKQLTLGTA